MGKIVKYIPSRDQIAVKNIVFFDKSLLEQNNPMEEFKEIHRQLRVKDIISGTEGIQFAMELSEYIEGELKWQIEEAILTNL
jgi:hypothetical protein